MRSIRAIGSIIIGAFGWLVFGFLWWWAFSQTGTRTQEFRGLLGIAAFSLLVIIVSLLWVRYNVWLYHHRKWVGPRHDQPTPYDYSIDTMDRLVSADFTGLSESRYITIDLEETDGKTVKVYRSGSEDLTENEVAVCEVSLKQ